MADLEATHRNKRMKKTPLDDIDELEDDPKDNHHSNDEDYESNDDEDSNDEDPTYEGETDSNGQWHGQGKLTWLSSEMKFEGHFENGVKTGFGKFTFADGSSLEGNYVDDAINGEGKYTFCDGRVIKGSYADGTQDGPVEEFDSEGSILFRGAYKDGIRHYGTLLYDDGGKAEGSFNEEGQLHGENVTYYYPGWYCALKGMWKNGIMKKVRFEILEQPYTNCNIDNDKAHYHYDVSTATQISEQPLLPDPYESITVYVAKSSIANSGEGLFAKHDIPADRVVSFYNGIRLTLEEVDARDWTLNNNTISLQYEDEEGEDKTVIIDVPKPFDSTVHYCASLGHKVNHSSSRCNSKYDTFDHPRFGIIKCIRTLQPVKKDEEFLVTYDYEHGEDGQDVPDWYKREVSNANK